MAFLKEHGWIICLLVLLGGLYSSTVQSHGMFMWDEAEYASISLSLSNGEGFAINGRPNSLRPPILPLSGAATILISGEATDAILMIPIVLFALLALVIVYVAVRLEHGRSAGLLAALFLGLAPSFWQHTSYYLSEVPFIALFAGAVLFMYHGLYRDKKYFAVSWACFGLALMTRYTALLFGPVLILLLIVAFMRSRKNSDILDRLLSKSFFLSPVVALVFIVPWLVRQQITFGDALTGFRRASRQLQTYLPGVSMPRWFYFDALPDMLTWTGIMLLAVGLLWGLKNRGMLTINCVLVILFFFVWFGFYRYKEVRLITAILPFLAVVSGIGTIRILESMWPKVNSLIWTVVIGLVFFAFSNRATEPTFRLSKTLGYPVFTQALEFIHANSEEDDVVMGTSTPQVFWYTGRKTIGFPGEPEDLKERLDEVEWVVIVNFERGHQKYVLNLMSKFNQADLSVGNARLFKRGNYAALVGRASVLRSRL